jgi:type I restriction enzyme R subunit
MDQDELDKVESPAIMQLKQLGCTYIHGTELTPEAGARSYLSDAVLVNHLDGAIKRINLWISDENLRRV